MNRLSTLPRILPNILPASLPTNLPTMLRVVVVMMTLLSATGCLEACEPMPPDPLGAVGRIEARAVTGGFEIVLSELETPLRSVSVAVAVDGGNATRAEAAGELLHNIVEAGLQSPSSAFTIVVSDSRRILLTDGAIARIDVDGPASIALADAVGVDENGERVVLSTGASE